MRKAQNAHTTAITRPLLSTLELCAGAGGQALGLEQAGIEHIGLIEIDSHACATLRLNRAEWNVLEQDLTNFTDAAAFKGVDLVSGGLPCPPFSKAGRQLGHKDERNLFPAAIHIVDHLRPRAVMIENVRGILDAVFEDYRKYIAGKLQKLGYVTELAPAECVRLRRPPAAAPCRVRNCFARFLQIVKYQNPVSPKLIRDAHDATLTDRNQILSAAPHIWFLKEHRSISFAPHLHGLETSVARVLVQTWKSTLSSS